MRPGRRPAEQPGIDSTILSRLVRCVLIAQDRFGTVHSATRRTLRSPAAPQTPLPPTLTAAGGVSAILFPALPPPPARGWPPATVPVRHSDKLSSHRPLSGHLPADPTGSRSGSAGTAQPVPHLHRRRPVVHLRLRGRQPQRAGSFPSQTCQQTAAALSVGRKGFLPERTHQPEHRPSRLELAREPCMLACP